MRRVFQEDLCRQSVLLALGLLLSISSLAVQAQRNLDVRPSSAAERRVALVIGNDAYRTVSKLERAARDARAMGAELRRLGFEVLVHANLDRRGMNLAIGELVDKVGGGGVAVLFFAGHGVQVSGANYLLPVDITVGRADDLADEAIDLGRVMDRLAQAKAKFTLLIVDACRDNPFPKVAGRAIGGGRGLTIPSAPDGLMVVYSAGINEQALDKLSDADKDPNGVFTREFIKQLRVPGRRVDDMVRRVRSAVREQALKIGHAQNPAIYDQSSGDFYFALPTGGTIAAPAQVPVAVVDPRLLEITFWESIKDSKSAEEIKAYLEQYPQGQFASLARARLATLEKPQTTSVAPATLRPPEPNAEAAANDRAFWDSIKNSKNPDELKAYLTRYPNGLFASIAGPRLESLEATRAQALAPAERLTGNWVSTTNRTKYRIHGKGRSFTITGPRRFEGSINEHSISGTHHFFMANCGQTTNEYRVICNVPEKYSLSGELSRDANSIQLRYEEPELQVDTTGGFLGGLVTMTIREKFRKQVTETLVRDAP